MTDAARIGELSDVWDSATTPVRYVVDEQGVNVYDAQVRHLGGQWWLYVDESEGYAVLTDDDVEDLLLVETKPTLGYEPDGSVVDMG